MEKNKRINRFKERNEEIYLNKKVEYGSWEIKDEKRKGKMKVVGSVVVNKQYKGTVKEVPVSKRRIKFVLVLDDNVKLTEASKEFVIKGMENVAFQAISNVNNGIDVDIENGGSNESNEDLLSNECSAAIESSNKCSYKHCNITEKLITTPCSICGNEGHHICSNKVMEDSLDKRYCSFSCAMGNKHGKDIVVEIDEDLQISDASDDGENNIPCDALDKQQRLDLNFISNSIQDEEEKLLEEISIDRDESIEKLISKENFKKMEWDFDREILHDDETLYKNKYRIKNQTILEAEGPIKIFRTLFPDTLWDKINVESNRYREEHYPNIKELTCIEIMRFVGLLIARCLNPWSCGLKNHWRQTSEGT